MDRESFGSIPPRRLGFRIAPMRLRLFATVVARSMKNSRAEREEVVDALREHLPSANPGVGGGLRSEVFEHAQDVLVEEGGGGLRQAPVQAPGARVERIVQCKRARGVRGPAVSVRVEEAG